MKKGWQKVLNEIWYAKISPSGISNKMEIVMYPNYDFVFADKDFDFKAFELFLKEHVENKPNQICFPKSCWKLKGQSAQTEEWLNSPVIKITTDTKTGKGGHYKPPLKLLKNKPKGAVEVEKKKPIWWDKWVNSRSYKKKYGKWS